ncbi:hypothetical protein F5879DRAFT_812454, partial [Lentinula edodes]
HLHRIGKADSPTCPCCKRATETVAHFLFDCPAHRRARGRLQRKLPNQLWSLGPLLSTKQALSPLFRYINDTKRFHHIVGELPELCEDDEDRP